MFRNFVKVTLRILCREKMYAVINIAGLSLALACCLILGLYLRSEFTYDRYNLKYRQIYRIVNELNINGRAVELASTSSLLGPMLTEEYSVVKGFVRFRRTKNENDLIRYEDKAFYWKNVCFASDNVFDVFTHDIIYGDPNTALVDPTSAAVSERFAKKYFGNANPIGKIIHSEQYSHRITLVFADMPENSHFRYDVLFSYNHPSMIDHGISDIIDKLLNLTDYTYLLMPKNYNETEFREISDSFFKKYLTDLNKLNASWKCWIQPIADIHYNSHLERDEPVGNRFYLYGLLAVAIFILVVAGINYMNLATARASKRSKEVGMRKTLGSGKSHLIIQFLGEAILFSLISIVLGAALAQIVFHFTPLNELLGKSLSLDLNNEPGLSGWILALGLVFGLLSGAYPALYLSSILPMHALVGGYRAGKKGNLLRKMLLLIQLTISVGVIACTLLMVLQMRYISNKYLGFKKENRLIITIRGGDLVDKVPVIKKELNKNSSILGVSPCSGIIGKPSGGLATYVENNDNVPEMTTFRIMEIGDDFFKVMGMELITGRDFSKRLITDAGTPGYIVNETMVKKMGWDQPLGKGIAGTGKVIGVVKDFHHMPLHNPIEPFAFERFSGTRNTPIEKRQGMVRYLMLDISGKTIPGTLNYLEEKFTEFDPKHPFEYEFLDDSLNNMYLTEQHLMKLVGIFACVCIVISCMGLFGMSAFNTEQRTREIGIRKVLGASTWQIITILVRNIMVLALTGAIFASLLTIYVMDEWLANFAYHTGIKMWIFLLSTVVVAVVSFITVTIQSFNAARANPVETLRYE